MYAYAASICIKTSLLHPQLTGVLAVFASAVVCTSCHLGTSESRNEGKRTGVNKHLRANTDRMSNADG